jgi:hypothetical protein
LFPLNLPLIAKQTPEYQSVKNESVVSPRNQAAARAAGRATSAAARVGTRTPNIVIPTAVRNLPANRLLATAPAVVIVAFAKSQNLVNFVGEKLSDSRVNQLWAKDLR